MLGLSDTVRHLRPLLERNPPLKALAKQADIRAARLHHSLAARLPQLIRPAPRQLTIAITSHCNLHCVGCHYGSGDFMPGKSLSLETVCDAVSDARQAGIDTVRFYGGEPLLHPDLPAMVAHTVKQGLRVYVTSNGTHLKHKIDPLFQAGLRMLTIGFYGLEDAYEAYTRRRGHFARLEQGLQTVRARYGDAVQLQLNFVVMRPACHPQAWQGAWEFARRFNMYFHLDLVGSTTPFFKNDPHGAEQFQAGDRPALDQMVAAFLRYKSEDPVHFVHSPEFIRSVPDWVLHGSGMRVPCDAYRLLWIGADGTVQLCDTAFRLGNLHEQPLRDIMFTRQHRQAARDGFLLNCPNCMCKVESRIQKHAPSVRRYGAQ